MNIIVFCAAGYSSSMLVNELKKYVHEHNLNYTFTAKNCDDFKEKLEDDYDVVLLGPQISYKYEQIQECCDIPVLCINRMDYALCNAVNIISMIQNRTR